MCTDLRRDYPVYTRPAQTFFKHIASLGLQTQEFLARFPDDAAKDARLTNSKRLKLLTLRTSWDSLHEYVGAVLDADTLHLPGPLLTLFETLLRPIMADDDADGTNGNGDQSGATEGGQLQAKTAKYEFAVFHTNQANYLQVPSSIARDVANDIALLIGGKSFPPDLGLVGIPYSSCNGLFLNCLIPHELGHIVYQETELGEQIENSVDNLLEKMQNEIDPTARNLSWCREKLIAWGEEMFCDLFAICLIGPAYSFAFSELMAASHIVGQEPGSPKEFFDFASHHPAGAFRFRVHAALLVNLGWWDTISDWTSAPIEVLRTRTDLRLYDLGLDALPPEGVQQNPLIDCFSEVCNWLIDFVISAIPTDNALIQSFNDQSPTISQYLKRAVVPSSIVLKQKGVVYPGPIVILNSTFRFYLEELPELIRSVEGDIKDDVESRSKYSMRLELWALKGIEDSRLLAYQEKWPSYPNPK